MTAKLGAQGCCSAWALGLGRGPEGHQQFGCLSPSCKAIMERVESGGLAHAGAWSVPALYQQDGLSLQSRLSARVQGMAELGLRPPAPLDGPLGGHLACT